MPEALIIDAIRTPMGRKGGQLSEVRGDQLLAECLKALVKRNGFDPAEVEDVVGGCVTQTDEQGVCVIRQAVLASGWPKTVPGVSLNRLCGSGQQAVAFAAQEILSGQSDLTVGCGMENMSRVAMGSDMGPFNDELSKRFDVVSQGISAELMAERWALTRAELDAFSATRARLRPWTPAASRARSSRSPSVRARSAQTRVRAATRAPPRSAGSARPSSQTGS